MVNTGAPVGWKVSAYVPAFARTEGDVTVKNSPPYGGMPEYYTPKKDETPENLDLFFR